MKIMVLTCRNCGVAQWGVLATGEFALQCKCGQFNTKGQMWEEITGRCFLCNLALDDHDWIGNLAVCVKGRQVR